MESNCGVSQASRSGKKYSSAVWKHLHVRRVIFTNEISQEQISNPTGGHQSDVRNTTDDLQRVPGHYATLGKHPREGQPFISGL